MIPYYKDLIKYSRKLVRNKEDREDLVQDTVVKYLENKEKIKDNEKYYIMSTVYNLNINNYRHSRNTKRIWDFEKISRTLLGDYNIDNYMIQEEIKKFSKTLPRKEEEAFVYTLAFNGPREATEHLNVNYESFRTHWRRSMLKWKAYAYE